MDLELLSMMPHLIGIQPYLSRDAWGKKTFGAIVLFQGRVESKRRKIIGADGEEVISETTIYLATVSGIGMQDRVTLQSGYLPPNPLILAIRRQDNEYGIHHTVIYV
jgi:hypothetical protein